MEYDLCVSFTLVPVCVSIRTTQCQYRCRFPRGICFSREEEIWAHASWYRRVRSLRELESEWRRSLHIIRKIYRKLQSEFVWWILIDENVFRDWKCYECIRKREDWRKTLVSRVRNKKFVDVDAQGEGTWYYLKN